MQSLPSDYQLALQSLLKNYLTFTRNLNRYIEINPNATPRLKQLAKIWSHPKGMTNLITTIALNPHLRAPAAQEQLKEPTAPLVKEEYIIPEPVIEVKSPSIKVEQANVKEEEDEEDDEMMECTPRRSRSNKKYIEMDQSYSQSSNGNRSVKRGPYKSYSIYQKEKAVHLFRHQNLSITEISKMLSIPCKNIKRWSTQGVSRKRGGGRKRSSPIMESEVKNWITKEFAHGEVVEIERIQEFALAVNKDECFKASRGWVLKFIERHHLKGKYTFK